MINNGVITLNGVVIPHSNVVIKVGDIVGVQHHYNGLMQHDLFLRYINNVIF
jgi:hypothetical protein